MKEKFVCLLIFVLACSISLLGCSESSTPQVNDNWEDIISSTVQEASSETISQEETSQIDEMSDEKGLFNQFIEGTLKVKDTESDRLFSLDDLNKDADEWCIYSVDGFNDYNNDGDDELYLNGPYGGMILDIVDGNIEIMAQGEGTAYQMEIIEYENATWIVNEDISHGGRQLYHFRKFKGSKVIDEFDLNAEYWDNESGFYDKTSDFSFRGGKISMKEYENQLIKILPSHYWRPDMFAGTFSLKGSNVISIKEGVVDSTPEGNVFMYHDEIHEESKYQLSDDVYIYLYYPVNNAYGLQINSNEFYDLLKKYEGIDCYYHINDEGKINWIRGIYYS